MNTTRQRDDTPQRVGLFGGTFNPIHRGHIQVAREVLTNFDLECIHFIPCAVPPHKLQGPLAPAADRLAMARHALGQDPRLRVSDIEIRRSGPSYTIDTLRTFHDALSDTGSLFFLLGLDAFLELHTWKSYRQVLDLAALIIMSRPMKANASLNLAEVITAYAHQHLSADYRLSQNDRELRHPGKPPLYLAQVTSIDIASSQIRTAINQRKPIDPWVAPAVARYIAQKGLYQ